MVCTKTPQYEPCKGFLWALLLAGFLWLVSISLSDAAARQDTYVSEPLRHIAYELQQKRVVALADFAHENAYPFQTVIQVLNHWLDDPNRTGHSLTLGLEADTTTAQIAEAYMKSGDRQPLLDYLLPFTSLERLEFYDDLRLFYLKLEKINSTRQPTQQIQFRLAGFEPASLFSASQISSKDVTTLEAALKDRDNTIAKNVLEYLEDHPSNQLLLFYGMDHLRKRPSKTSYLKKLFGGAQSHYYMAHYLAAKLGDDFLTVAQTAYPRELRNPDNPDRNLTIQDLFFKSADIPWKLTRIDPADFDAVIFLHPVQIYEPHYLRFVCSRRVIEQAINKMVFLQGILSHPLSQTYYQRAQEGLHLITGQSFEDPNAWKQWLQTHNYDGLQYLESKTFAEQVFSIFNTPASQNRTVKLMSLGLPVAFANSSRRFSEDQWFDKVWPKLLPPIKFINCLGIYWLGYPEEKEKAKPFLIEFTAKDFDSPAAYIKWYRRQYLHLAY